MYAKKRASLDPIQRQMKNCNTLLSALRDICLRNVEEEVKFIPKGLVEPRTADDIGRRTMNSEYVGTMPLGILCTKAERISVNRTVVVDKILGSTNALSITGNVELHPIGKEILKRSTSSVGNKRMFSMNFTELRAQELNRQCQSVRSDIHAVVDEMERNYKDLPHLRDMYVNQQLKLFQLTISRLDSTQFLKNSLSYVVRKKKSSIIKGKKYRDLLIYNMDGTLNEPLSLANIQEYSRLLSRRIKEIVNLLIKYRMKMVQDNYQNILAWVWPHFNFGIRQRPGDTMEEFEQQDGSYKCKEIKHRDRWVIFIWPLGHIWLPFSKEEVHNIEIAMINDYARLVDFKIDSPIISKGKIFAKLKARLESGEKAYFGDGVRWEVIAGMITMVLGVVWLGYFALASGISLTSMTGIIAMIWVLAYFESIGKIYPYYISTFGDDIFVLGKMQDIEHVIEADKDANDYKIYLGISLQEDEVLAFKYFKDRGDKMVSKKLADLENQIFVNNSNLNQRIVMYITYGYVKDIVTLIELVGKVDYIGGGNLTEYIEVEIVNTKWWDELVNYDKRHLDLWNGKFISEAGDKFITTSDVWITEEDEFLTW